MKRHVKSLFRFDRPTDAVYVELVDSLFNLVPPIVILSICLSLVGAAIVAGTRDPIILVLTLLAVLTSAERIVMVYRYRKATAAAPLSLVTAWTWERRFATRSCISTVIVSLMGARCFMLPHPHVHMLIVGVLFAYGAGTITRVAYRPCLAIMNLLIISVPSIVASIYIGGPVYLCLALVMVVFLVGAFETVRHLYATIVSQLTLKLRFANLARRDPLTGLSNRLALSENLENAVAAAYRDSCSLAIHSLDLNHFKTANDRFGHPAGDAILQEVARRLSRLTREKDLLVRLGGDEFVLVQTDVRTREQAQALAKRIITDIATTYHVDGNAISLSTSVGIALMSCEQTLTPEELLNRADQALYQAKRNGSGYVIYAIPPQLVPPLAADEVEDPRRNATAS